MNLLRAFPSFPVFCSLFSYSKAELNKLSTVISARDQLMTDRLLRLFPKLLYKHTMLLFLFNSILSERRRIKMKM